MLTEKDKRFCELFVKYNNAKKAYREAFEIDPTKTTNLSGRVLKKPEVQEYLELLRKEAFEDFCIDARHIATTLADIAFNEENSNKDRLKALDLLQKQFSLQTQKVQAETTITVEIE